MPRWVLPAGAFSFRGDGRGTGSVRSGIEAPTPECVSLAYATGAARAARCEFDLDGGKGRDGSSIDTLGPLLPTDIVQVLTPGGGFWSFDQNRIFPDPLKNLGAPFTTGTVVVQNTGTFEGQPATTTLSLRASPNTSMGVGNVALVAGGLSSRVFSNQDTSRLTYVRMVTFAPEPGASLLLGVALVGLGGACRVVCRRSSR